MTHARHQSTHHANSPVSCLRRLRHVGAGALIGLAASACGGGNTEFTRDHDGSTQTMQVGEQFDIRLGENGSTGFSWKLVSAELPSVELAGEDYEPNSDLDGAGGTKVFTFDCIAQGASTIELVSSQGEPGPELGPGDKTYSLEVVVE